MQDEAEQKATILIHFYPEVTVEKMSSYRKKLTWKSKFQCKSKFHHALKFFDFLELWEAKSL